MSALMERPSQKSCIRKPYSFGILYVYDQWFYQACPRRVSQKSDYQRSRRSSFLARPRIKRVNESRMVASGIWLRLNRKRNCCIRIKEDTDGITDGDEVNTTPKDTLLIDPTQIERYITARTKRSSLLIMPDNPPAWMRSERSRSSTAWSSLKMRHRRLAPM
nr:hypothetical protein [Brevibacillus fluminis]